MLMCINTHTHVTHTHTNTNPPVVNINTQNKGTYRASTRKNPKSSYLLRWKRHLFFIEYNL